MKVDFYYLNNIIMEREMRVVCETPVWSQRDFLVLENRIKDTLERYGKKRTALLPCLEVIQETAGYITPDSVSYLRDALDIPAADIYNVASFYSLLTTTLQGKYIVRTCNSLSCHINGAASILQSVENELGIRAGKTTPDKQFSLEVVPCLGLCDQAPAMMINDKIYGFLTEKSIKRIFDSLRDNG
jgi:NADH-quinone oxidoreductase E subunit